MEWKTFGWQGFVMRVPGDWDLAAQQGGGRKGYFRLDDSTMPRLEVKWERKRRAPKLDSMERAYRAGLRKAKGLESLALPGRGGPEVPGAGTKRFRWRGKVFIDDTLVSYTGTKRAASIRVLARSKRRVEEASRGVLSSFRDLGEGEETVWTAYGFACAIPAGYGLLKADLRAGFVLLRFQRGRDRVEFQRLRLGVVPEEARDVERWGERVLGKQKGKMQEMEYSGHEGRTYLLRGIRPVSRARAPLRKQMSRAWLWRCPGSESLYLVKRTGPAETGPEGWRVWCHGAPESEGSA